MDFRNVIEKKTEVINTEFSDRHRIFYGPLPAMDLDMIEYKKDMPAILFEAKHGSIVTIDLADKQFIRLRNTADKLNIPAFCLVYYYPGLNKVNNKQDEFGKKRKYYIIPINNLARGWLFLTEPKLITEKEFVELIYKIKNQPMPELTLDDELDFYPKTPLVLNKRVGTSSNFAPKEITI